MSEMKAIFLPSGDQAANLSWAPELFVRLRTGPFSMGAVSTSPRATKSARSPLGESPKDSMFFSTGMRDGRDAPPSVGTWIEMGVSECVRRSSTCSSPFSS